MMEGGKVACSLMCLECAVVCSVTNLTLIWCLFVSDCSHAEDATRSRLTSLSTRSVCNEALSPT